MTLGIHNDVREALGTEQGTDVTFSVNDAMLVRHMSFGNVVEKSCSSNFVTVNCRDQSLSMRR